jgi:succinoglycan biosynthesis protein ExoW
MWPSALIEMHKPQTVLSDAIVVVIPFYQRERGILPKALKSVHGQIGVSEVRVIVVDDDSPVPAVEELRALDGSRFPVTVLKQPNGGPGAARNKALDNLSAGTRYVAFLDSDDEWTPTHLANAVDALRRDHDVYFADLMQLNAPESAFRRAGRIAVQAHPLLDATGTTRSYREDMFNQILTGNVIGTPTVVYDFSKFSAIRFRTDFRHAGEDYLFWLELAASGARFAFSTDIECICGRGVNVYSGSGWGTEASLRCLYDEVRYRKAIRVQFSLTPPQDVHLRKRIRQLRMSFVQDLLHRLSHGRPVPLDVAIAYFRLDPLILLFGPPLALWAVSNTLVARAKGRI